MKKIICFVAAVICAMSMMACGGNATATTTAAPETTVEETTVALAPYKAGTFTATAQGMGKVTVTLTFDEAGVITACEIDASGETPGLGDKAAAKLVDVILNAQSAEFDGISGASITSAAVKNAVADCLAQAAN